MPARQRIPTPLAGLAMAAIFGFSFLFTKQTLAYLSPIHLLGLRFTLAALALTALVLAGLVRVDLGRRRWLRLLPLAVLQPVAYFLCETYGVKYTSASEAGMIIGAIPVVVALLAAVWLGERLSWRRYFFVFCSTLGVGIMVAGGGIWGGGDARGLLLLVGAVLAASCYSMLSRRQSTEFAPIEITLIMMWAGAVVFDLLALSDVLGGRPFPLAALARPSVWSGLLYLSLLSSVGAFFLVNTILGRLEAARASAYTNLTTAVSVLAGVFILGETFHWYEAIGGAMIAAGVWGANRRETRRGSTPPPSPLPDADPVFSQRI